MKNLLKLSFLLFSLSIIASCDKETIVGESDLPVEIKTYIETHFPASTISRAVKDKDGTELYEITLTNGVKLEFNKQNEIIDIDGNSKLPDSVIPSLLLNYSNTNYPTNFITGWELMGSEQEVKLNNGLELIFNIAGDFIRIDN